MTTLAFHREVFRHRTALQLYLRGAIPEMDAVQQGLYLQERENDSRRPDHTLRQLARLTTAPNATIRDLVSNTITWMSMRYLKPAGYKHICVPWEVFEEWQELITSIPPLLVVARALLTKCGLPDERPLRRRSVRVFLEEHIQPQVRFSSLPTVHEPRLDYLIEKRGLDEMHMHLNGASEIETVWLDALASPEKFATHFLRGKNKTEVIEQLNQVTPGLCHENILSRLVYAVRLRRILERCSLLPLSGDTSELPKRADVMRLFSDNDAMLVEENSDREECHPVDRVFRIGEDFSSLTKEAFFLMAVYEALDRNSPPDALAHAFYAYTLIKCEFSRLLVLQRDQYGFDQFQKVTVNEMRELTEKSYWKRFYQLAYTAPGDLDTLEARFAPKNDVSKMVTLFDGIMTGYRDYLSGEETASENMGLKETLEKVEELERSSKKRLRLALVGHFIKRRDDWMSEQVGEMAAYPCRHYMVRSELSKGRRALRRVIDDFGRLRRHVVGFDAAANELHAPPEVFAPLFRHLRCDGYHNFTYHAGEDFVHLLSGIRAVFEALAFLDLQPGNRIGHATAVGMCPDLWHRRIGPVVVTNMGDRLDDLVFARWVLLGAGGSGAKLAEVDAEISRLSRCIYGEPLPPDLLLDAWKMRSCDPLAAFDYYSEVGAFLDPAIRDEYVATRKEKDRNASAFDVFTKYHSDTKVISRSLAPIAVGTEDAPEILDPDDLRRIQNIVLDEFNRRKVAIETLLTSNLRISVYEHYKEHHIFRWLGFAGARPKVSVCIGSDDPGVFATNLRNEYAHLLRELDIVCAASEVDPSNVLDGLISNGKRFRFRPPPEY